MLSIKLKLIQIFTNIIRYKTGCVFFDNKIERNKIFIKYKPRLEEEIQFNFEGFRNGEEKKNDFNSFFNLTNSNSTNYLIKVERSTNLYFFLDNNFCYTFNIKNDCCIFFFFTDSSIEMQCNFIIENKVKVCMYLQDVNTVCNDIKIKLYFNSKEDSDCNFRVINSSKSSIKIDNLVQTQKRSKMDFQLLPISEVDLDFKQQVNLDENAVVRFISLFLNDNKVKIDTCFNFFKHNSIGEQYVRLLEFFKNKNYTTILKPFVTFTNPKNTIKHKICKTKIDPNINFYFLKKGLNEKKINFFLLKSFYNQFLDEHNIVELIEYISENKNKIDRI